MDFLDNKQNRRILNGYFPTNSLRPVIVDIDRFSNYDEAVKEQMIILQNNPELLGLLLSAVNKKTKIEFDSLNDPESRSSEINCFINANRHPDTLVFNGSYEKALDLYPVATTLDECLWLMAKIHFDMILKVNANEDENHRTIMHTFAYLLIKAQEAEYKTGQTLDFSKSLYEIPLSKVIDNGFDSLDSAYLINLSKKEKTDLERIMSKRNDLISDIEKEDQISRDVSQKTNREWNTFLQIFNDLSKRRNKVINILISDSSLSEKKETIKNYKSLLSRIEKDKVYYLNKNRINLVNMFDKINNRLFNAPSSTFVCINNKDPFRLHPSAPVLIMHPFGFDHLLIMFHDLRLNNSEESVNQFFSTALEFIERNLSFPVSENLSFMDTVIRFKDVVFEFVEKNKEKIQSLSFDEIQSDNIALDSSSVMSFESEDILNKRFSDYIRNCDDNLDNESLERFFNGEVCPASIKQIDEMRKRVLNEFEEIDDLAFASRIISSLNIIFLFCGALRMTVSLKPKLDAINFDVLTQIRHDLLALDDRLIHLVYSHLDENKIGMIEYRELKGIDTRSLSEQEIREERNRNQTVSVVLKDSINRILDNINSNDIDHILNSKKEIQKEIFSCPNCEEKEQFVLWLDSVTEKLCEMLIDNIKNKEDDFSLIKNTITSSLGTSNLPDSTIDSLATAEILYARYANLNYAEEGFDFSCISALYYQAFEDAYNRLIWRDYANYLNTPQGTNPAFVDCLDSYINRNITDTHLLGYLFDTNPKQRNYYIDYRNRSNPQTVVKDFCMYKPFGILLEQVKQSNGMIHFHDYISRKAGFNNSHEMFSNGVFMNKFDLFVNNILNSADNRNNASHGGTTITRIQCENDKKAVIDNLKQIRENNFGLIQQLSYICFSQK